jgi:hypothetical protein
MPTPQELDDEYWNRRALELQYDGPIPDNATACPSIIAGLKRAHIIRAQSAGVALATQILSVMVKP